MLDRGTLSILSFVILAIKAMSALALLCLLTPAAARPRFGLGSTRSQRQSYRRNYVPSRPNRLASNSVAVRMRPRGQVAAYSQRGYTRHITSACQPAKLRPRHLYVF